MSDGVVLGGQGGGETVESIDGGGDVVALAVDGTKECVQAGEGVADLALTAVQGVVDVADDISDLCYPAGVDE